MKKLNPFWYMVAMGMGLGGGLGGSYTLIVVLADSDLRFVDSSARLEFLPFAFILGAIIGGLAGVLLGMLNGFFLWFMSYKQQNPFTVLELKPAIQTVIAIMTTLGGFFILFIMVLGNIQAFYNIYGIFALLPPFIAGAAAVYASHRYFVHLSPYDKQKEK